MVKKSFLKAIFFCSFILPSLEAAMQPVVSYHRIPIAPTFPSTPSTYSALGTDEAGIIIFVAFCAVGLLKGIYRSTASTPSDTPGK